MSPLASKVAKQHTLPKFVTWALRGTLDIEPQFTRRGRLSGQSVAYVRSKQFSALFMKRQHPNCWNPTEQTLIHPLTNPFHIASRSKPWDKHIISSCHSRKNVLYFDLVCEEMCIENPSIIQAVSTYATIVALNTKLHANNLSKSLKSQHAGPVFRVLYPEYRYLDAIKAEMVVL